MKTNCYKKRQSSLLFFKELDKKTYLNNNLNSNMIRKRDFLTLQKKIYVEKEICQRVEQYYMT